MSRGFFLRFARLTATRVVGLFILLWLSVAVLLAANDVSRPWLLSYGAATLVFAFFVAGWAMLRTAARLRGLLDEGDAPDGGLLLEALPCAGMALSRRGKVRALNNQWLELLGLPRNQVWRRHYARFCDPALRRHLDRAFRAAEGSANLFLSTRQPTGTNVFFQADIRPLGEGWLVVARPLAYGDQAEADYEADRLLQLGKATAGLLPALARRLEDDSPDRSALEALASLAEWLVMPPAETSAVAPASLLAETEKIVRPILAARGLTWRRGVADDLPSIQGRPARLAYALLVILLFAIDHAAPGGEVSAEAEKAGKDLELSIEFPPDPDSPVPDNPFVLLPENPAFGLAVARQIAREIDGDLHFRAAPPADRCRFRLSLPVAGKRTSSE